MKEIIEHNYFQCSTCGIKDEFTLEGLKEHMGLVHSIDELKGTKSLLGHMDASDFYTYTFLINIGPVEIVHHILQKRKEAWA